MMDGYTVSLQIFQSFVFHRFADDEKWAKACKQTICVGKYFSMDFIRLKIERLESERVKMHANLLETNVKLIKTHMHVMFKQ